MYLVLEEDICSVVENVEKDSKCVSPWLSGLGGVHKPLPYSQTHMNLTRKLDSEGKGRLFTAVRRFSFYQAPSKLTTPRRKTPRFLNLASPPKDERGRISSE